MNQFTEKDIVTYRNFLKPEDFDKVSNQLDKDKWSWGQSSIPVTEESDFITPFWYMVLEEEFFTDYLLGLIEKKTKQNYTLDRCYCNGMTHGMTGIFHTDSTKDNSRTALLYSNFSWQQDWEGKTVFYINGKTHYVDYIPNSLVIFPGSLLHRAESTSRLFTGLRTTVAWKLNIT